MKLHRQQIGDGGSPAVAGDDVSDAPLLQFPQIIVLRSSSESDISSPAVEPISA